MKKVLFVLAILVAIFIGCPQPTDNTAPEEPAPSLTIKNESSYDLSQVKWSGISFASPNSSDLLKTSSVSKPEGDQTTGYITFIRKDIGIACRTNDLISINGKDETFTFTNNTVVVESGNDSNKNPLSTINFLSHIAVESNGRTVPKQDTVSLGETVHNSTKEIVFTLKNTGVGKLILNGNEPIKISGEGLEGAFAVIQPTSSEIASGSSLPFTIKFTPKTIKAYAATVTISSNDPSGDYTFNLSGDGVASKAIITIWYGEDEISQNGTVELGEGVITQSKTAQIRIKNTGTLVLNIETANITITGTDAAAFSMISSPIAAISEGNESTFTVQFSPTSTGEKSAAITIPNDDSSRNPAVIIIKGTGKQEYPVIELKNNTTVIDHNGEKDFGRVEIGQTKTESFSIKNTGLVNLVLSGESLVSSSSAKFAIITQPKASLSPNEETSFTVRYTPDVEQEDEAEISISGNTQSGLFKFTVKGTGYTKKPQITVKQNTTSISSNGSYNFGSVVATKQKDIAFTIENTGEAALTLSGEPRIQITDDAESLFTVTQQPGSTPIAPGGAAETFIVRFSPATTGAKTAKVKIISNSGGSQGEFIFTVSGTATEASSESRLSSLTFTKGKLDQQFHADIKNYTLKVDAAETIIKVTPAALNANITSLTVNGKTQNSGVASEDIILASTNTITIVVTAENESAYSTYTITIQSVVNYSSTALSQFWVSNMAGDDEEDVIALINSNSNFTWLSLPDTTQLKFKPVLANSNATIKVNGTAIAHNTYTSGYDLTPGAATTTFSFTVISEDGENERSFTVPCRYYGTQWEKVGDFPIGSMSYYPTEHTVVVHNDLFIMTNINEVFTSSTGTSWSKTVTFDDTIEHSYHSSVVYNNTIYNIGGFKKRSGTWEIANIISYSTSGTLFTVASSVSGLTGGVGNHASVVFNNAVYTLGGVTQTADQTNAVWR